MAAAALAMARELGYPAGEALALGALSLAALYAGDLGGAVQLARQAEQIPADIPGWIARMRSDILTVALTAAGDLAAAERCLRGGAGPVPGRGRPVEPWRSC